MSYSSSTNTKFCSHCKMIGKTHAEYTSHYVRKTPDQNSRITCPELLNRICKNCPLSNHTWDRCPLTKTQHSPSAPGVKTTTTTSNVKTTTTSNVKTTRSNTTTSKCLNRFSCLDELQFDPNQLDGLTPDDQKLCIGEEIYAKVAVNNQARAGMITGMLLEIDISELVEIFNAPERFNTIVEEANWVLDVAV